MNIIGIFRAVALQAPLPADDEDELPVEVDELLFLELSAGDPELPAEDAAPADGAGVDWGAGVADFVDPGDTAETLPPSDCAPFL